MESDEQQMQLNKAIQSLKNEIDSISTTIQTMQNEFKDVSMKRKDLFLDYFDRVAGRLEEVYKQLTQKSKSDHPGHASLTILDREQPFGFSIDDSSL